RLGNSIRGTDLRRLLAGRPDDGYRRHETGAPEERDRRGQVAPNKGRRCGAEPRCARWTDQFRGLLSRWQDAGADNRLSVVSVQEQASRAPQTGREEVSRPRVDQLM